jgi:phosphoribosylformimino-5-aminoimidazole carboxamide ribotide isomerase
MLIIPAIDIKGGKVVRLRRGDFKEETVYSSNPLEITLKFVSLGARLIHIVDLEGALFGELKNISVVEEISKVVTVPIEFGGGIRNIKTIVKILSKGVSKVVLGTRACEDEGFIKEALKDFQDRLIVSIDERSGRVATDGWSIISSLKTLDLAKKMEGLGVKSLIYTDVSKDGTLSGPNIKRIKAILSSVKIPVVACGGISSLEDIKKLKQLQPRGLSGVIIGKALYEGKINLKEAIEIAQ